MTEVSGQCGSAAAYYQPAVQLSDECDVLALPIVECTVLMLAEMCSGTSL